MKESVRYRLNRISLALLLFIGTLYAIWWCAGNPATFALIMRWPLPGEVTSNQTGFFPFLIFIIKLAVFLGLIIGDFFAFVILLDSSYYD